MSVRLVISIAAAPGKGAELAKAMAARCRDSQKDAGCEQLEVFQSALDPDRLCLLERWATAEDLAAHAKLNQTRASLPEGLRLGGGEREDYEYNRVR
ncbi:MAG: putative quinol monooxygenase [Stellaceae bacterium]